MSGSSGLALVLLSACTTAGPNVVLEEYRQAVRDNDWPRMHALSSRSTRSAVGPEELAAFAKLQGDDLDVFREPIGVRQVFELGDGRRVTLVEEDGAWRIETGGVAIANADTPEAALRTLLLGEQHMRLDIVRLVVPSRYAEELADDAALIARLESLAPRIQAARAALTNGLPQATVDGEAARLLYGDGKAVVFAREAGRWRILDIE